MPVNISHVPTPRVWFASGVRGVELHLGELGICSKDLSRAFLFEGKLPPLNFGRAILVLCRAGGPRMAQLVLFDPPYEIPDRRPSNNMKYTLRRHFNF